MLELALREAKSLGHDYIGTEHILLGVVRENEGVAARILLDFGTDAETVRNDVIRMLSGPGGPEERSGGDAKVEEVRAQKEAAIDAGDFELAAQLRDVERRLVHLRAEPPASVRSSRNVWTQWQPMFVVGLLLAVGILLGRAIWG